MKTIEQVLPRDKNKHILFHINMSDANDRSLEDLQTTIEHLQNSYTEKLYWGIEQYQDELEYSLVIYTMRVQTDAEYKEYMERRLKLIESNLLETQERRDVVAKALEGMK